MGLYRLFEGVCLTHVILTPGACGGGVQAAVPDTTSGQPRAAAGEFREASSCAQAQWFGVFPRKMTSNFQQNQEDAPRQPKVPPRDPTGAPRRSKGPQSMANVRILEDLDLGFRL